MSQLTNVYFHFNHHQMVIYYVLSFLSWPPTRFPVVLARVAIAAKSYQVIIAITHDLCHNRTVSSERGKYRERENFLRVILLIYIVKTFIFSTTTVMTLKLRPSVRFIFTAIARKRSVIMNMEQIDCISILTHGGVHFRKREHH